MHSVLFLGTVSAGGRKDLHIREFLSWNRDLTDQNPLARSKSIISPDKHYDACQEIRLLSNDCHPRISCFISRKQKSFLQIIWDISVVLQEWVLKHGNELAFLHFRFHCPEVSGFFKWVKCLSLVVNTSSGCFSVLFYDTKYISSIPLVVFKSFYVSSKRHLLTVG